MKKSTTLLSSLPPELVKDLESRECRVISNGYVVGGGGRFPIACLYGGTGEKSLEANSRIAGYSKLVAIGEDWAGNRWVLSLRRKDAGSVLFWDHETNEFTVVASSYREFLGCIHTAVEERRESQDEAVLTLQVLGKLSTPQQERLDALVERGIHPLGYDQADGEWNFLVELGAWETLQERLSELVKLDGITAVRVANGDWQIGSDVPRDAIRFEWKSR